MIYVNFKMKRILNFINSFYNGWVCKISVFDKVKFDGSNSSLKMKRMCCNIGWTFSSGIIIRG